MIRSIFYSPDNLVQKDLTTEELTAILARKEGLLWVDIIEEEKSICEPLLLNTFGFHPLAVADALDEEHVPRVDDWSTYLYTVLHAISYAKEEETPLQTFELDIFLGENYLVTYQAKAITIMDHLWESIQKDIRFYHQGADHLLYKICDEIIADYMKVVEKMDEVIDIIEDQIFISPHQTILENIFTAKRSLLDLRRIIAPTREVFNKLARGDDSIIEAHERVFFRDIYDHLVRLYDISENLRDLAAGVLDTYLSVVNNRMNDIMKILTIITTLFMPLSFITGFFGMNFFATDYPVHGWVEKPVFIIVMVSFIVLPVVMYWWMRNRKWM